jgi:hypothetical protein
MFDRKGFWLFFLIILLIFPKLDAQQTSAELKTAAWNLHALRVYPFTESADSLMEKVIENLTGSEFPTDYSYQSLSADYIFNRHFIENPASILGAQGVLLQKFVISPYAKWFGYAKQIGKKQDEFALPVFITEKSSESFSAKGLLEYFGAENSDYFINEYLGKINLSGNGSETLFLSVKSPLAPDARQVYSYSFSSPTNIDGVSVYEIAFYPKSKNETALEGYIYLDVNTLKPVQLVCTLNKAVNTGYVKEVLFVQTPAQKETLMYLGDEITSSLLVRQTQSDVPQNRETNIDDLLTEANRTRAYKNSENLLLFLLDDRLAIANGRLELSDITHFFSYNETEGVRLRAGINTGERLSRRWRAGGYAAYGLRDRDWKYRGDLAFSPGKSSLLNLTYIRDLNLPGYDLEQDGRDLIFYSLYHARTKNLSLQKLAKIGYEKAFDNWFSFSINAKYLYDKPVGIVQYDDITSSEIGFSFRYFPKERSFRVGRKKFVFHEADTDLELRHRTGIKGIFGSDYNYNITEFSAYRKIGFPLNVGYASIRITGGKVWNRLPFPLLFIPSGNQSYVYGSDVHNLMDYQEFITDRHIGGNLNLAFRWSPVKLFFPRNSICTNFGFKTIYGPLSDNNNPALHPELIPFNNGVAALGNSPYSEVSIGFSDIFGFLRVDYVYRLNYQAKGGIFVSTAFGL